MKILIVGNKKTHQQSAMEQLSTGHNLKIVDNLPKAIEAIKDFMPEVVLTSLMLPSTDDLSIDTLKKYPVGTESPLGFTLALYATLAQSVKGVALVADDHDDPVTESLDHLGHFDWLKLALPWKYDTRQPIFSINGKKVIFDLFPNCRLNEWNLVLRILMS